MIKKLTRHGNSLALILDRGILELLEIDADTPIEISTDGRSLIVSPVRDEEREARLEEALRKGNERYARMLRRLAE